MLSIFNTDNSLLVKRFCSECPYRAGAIYPGDSKTKPQPTIFFRRATPLLCMTTLLGLVHSSAARYFNILNQYRTCHENRLQTLLKPASNDKIAKNRFYFKDIEKHFHEIYAKIVFFVSSGILGMFALNELY